MSNIRALDMMVIDDVFEMNGGYVLNFSDRTFAKFFAEELNVDIDDPEYAKDGGSKGKRLRRFLQTVDKPMVARTLHALWEYREAIRMKFGHAEKLQNPHGRLLAVIDRLNAGAPNPANQTMASLVGGAVFTQLRADLLGLSSLEPNPRGFAFERFLKSLFDTFGLKARDAFRLRGEQIDGSFILSTETYLLEAKWQNLVSGAAELHTFHGKIDQKAAWSRGLFISYTGFSEDGLHAFGRGKKVICMDGHDIYDALHRELPINHVLDQKVRRAAETGFAFTRVRDLIPT
jgi:hypothetical protein